MAVKVTFAPNSGQNDQVYPDANSFHEDDKNNLHISTTEVNIGVVHSGYWLKAEVVADETT